MGIFDRSQPDVDDGGLRRRVDDLERRVAELEWALRATGASGAPPTPAAAPVYDAAAGGVSAEVRDLARSGDKIHAIKLLREQTGLGLRESKDIVDRL